jgi:hypothetical protein
MKWKHFMARKSRKTSTLDPVFESIKNEQGLALTASAYGFVTGAKAALHTAGAVLPVN